MYEYVDRFGRLFTWRVSSIWLFFSEAAVPFMPDYWLHVSFRFFSGMAVAGVCTTLFVISK